MFGYVPQIVRISDHGELDRGCQVSFVETLLPDGAARIGRSMSDNWKFTLACTRQEAEALAADQPALMHFEPQPVVMTSEPDPARPDNWQVDVYTQGPPSRELIETVLALSPSAGGTYTAAQLPDQDWVTLSQAGLDPIQAGRYFVHTAADAHALPAGLISLQIEAGLAFGTGQHATTTGCLQEIDALQQAPANALDLGTGTAILALAIAKRWPSALVTASDIDPIAVNVSLQNIEINGVRKGEAPGEIALVVADGLGDPLLARRGPYDLIVANILAGPLIEMAGPIAASLKPNGTLILAGLLETQADDVEAAYERLGLSPRSRRQIGDWPTLLLTRA